MNSSISDADAFAMVQAAAAAHDELSRVWPPESVQYGRALFVRGRGSVPSLDQIGLEIGLERASEFLGAAVAARRLKNAMLGYKSPCHYCSSTGDLVLWDFALMKVTASKFSLGPTLLTTAVSAVAFPLVGVAILKLPGRSSSGQAVHLKLVVCKACCRKHGNLFGLFLLNEERASHHPLWSPLHEEGFSKFLPEEKMPYEMKITPDRL